MAKVYEVDMAYTCTTTYTGVVRVEAANEADAEIKALAQVEKGFGAPPSNFESNEDSGDWAVENISEAE